MAQPNKMVKSKVTMIAVKVMIIFTFLLNRGLAQTSGSINGPTRRKDTIRIQVS